MRTNVKQDTKRSGIVVGGVFVCTYQPPKTTISAPVTKKKKKKKKKQ